MEQNLLEIRQITLNDKLFQNWYENFIPRHTQILKDKAILREKQYYEEINNYRNKMTKLSEVNVFFNQNHNRKVIVLKDINVKNISLYEGEKFLIDKYDIEMIEALAFKLSKDQLITQLLRPLI